METLFIKGSSKLTYLNNMPSGIKLLLISVLLGGLYFPDISKKQITKYLMKLNIQKNSIQAMDSTLEHSLRNSLHE